MLFFLPDKSVYLESLDGAWEVFIAASLQINEYALHFNIIFMFYSISRARKIAHFLSFYARGILRVLTTCQ